MSGFWDDLGRTLLLDVPYNTSLVLRSAATLGAACGLIGVFLLLRKRSLVADALAHATLPGVGIGFLLAIALGHNARSLLILLPAAAIAGVIGVLGINLLKALPRVREDAAIGAVLSVFFAIGVVLLGVIQMMPTSEKAGLHSFIFGQAATLTSADSRLILTAAAFAAVVSIATFKELRLLCFDPDFAGSIGFSRRALDALLMALVVVLTVIGLHAVGALLMVALLIIPAVAARFWTERLGRMAAIAALIGAMGAYTGAAASAAAARVPTGPAMVLACGGLLLVSMMIAPRRGLIIEFGRRWSLRAEIARQHLLRAMYERGEITGDINAPVMLADLRERRGWSRARLARLLGGAQRRGEVTSKEGGHILTPTGLESAARIVRTHRLWEHYLTTQADVAPSQVDRAVEEIEHVLGDAIVAELERSMQSASTQEMPESPHLLGEAPSTTRRDPETLP